MATIIFSDGTAYEVTIPSDPEQIVHNLITVIGGTLKLIRLDDRLLVSAERPALDAEPNEVARSIAAKRIDLSENAILGKAVLLNAEETSMSQL